MSVIGIFVVEYTYGKSLWMKDFFSLTHFCGLDQNPKTNICHKITIKHPYMIEGRQWLVAIYIFTLRRHMRMT